MLSKAFSAAPKLPDVLFPKKIAAEHNQKWKQFVPGLQSDDFIATLPGTGGFIIISRWSEQEFGLCFRSEENKVLKCHFSPPVSPTPWGRRVSGLWATSKMLKIPCVVS